MLLPPFLSDFLLNYSYLAVFIILLICGAGVPIPEDITLISAGAISGMGVANVHIMLIVSYCGILFGDLMMYGLGWKYGYKVRSNSYLKRVLTADRIQIIEEKFQKYGNWLIFIARFLPGLRSPIYVISGLTRRVSVVAFILMDSLAALLSVPFFVYLGYYGAENHEWIIKKLHEFKEIVIIVGVIGIFIGGVYWYRRYKRRQFFRQMRAQIKQRLQHDRQRRKPKEEE